MKVFVIIVTYNGSQWIKKCIDSIYDSSIALNIVVVDNNSIDETHSILEDFKNIHLIQNQENLGFGKANNLGITYSLEQKADYIMLLNQDVYIKTDDIKLLLEAHLNNKDYGIVSPIHLNGNGTSLDLRFSNYLVKNIKLISDLVLNTIFNTIYEVPFVNAAAWLVPSSTFEMIGGFDPIFYHYGEDVNFCQRLKYHGLKIGIAPNVFINHDRPQIAEFSNSSEDDNRNIIEKMLKVNFADINRNNVLNEYQNKIIVKKTLKALLKFDLSSIRKNLLEYKIINKIKLEVIRSRMINSSIGQHYL